MGTTEINDKQRKALDFKQWLIDNDINHEVHNFGWHIQINGEHQFYPSTNKYMNSNTGVIKRYKTFKSKKSFMKFIIENTIVPATFSFAIKPPMKATFDEDKIFYILDRMDRQGGGFVKKLAALYRSADDDNKIKIQNIWSNYFKDYE